MPRTPKKTDDNTAPAEQEESAAPPALTAAAGVSPAALEALGEAEETAPPASTLPVMPDMPDMPAVEGDNGPDEAGAGGTGFFFPAPDAPFYGGNALDDLRELARRKGVTMPEPLDADPGNNPYLVAPVESLDGSGMLYPSLAAVAALKPETWAAIRSNPERYAEFTRLCPMLPEELAEEEEGAEKKPEEEPFVFRENLPAEGEPDVPERPAYDPALVKLVVFENEEGGLGGLIDSETGEVYDIPDAPRLPNGAVMTSKDAEWYMGRLDRGEAAIDALKAARDKEIAELTARTTAKYKDKIRQEESKLEWLAVQYRWPLYRFASRAVSAMNGKVKHIKIGSRRLQFSKVGEGIEIYDMRKAVTFAETVCPEAVKRVEPTVLKPGILKAIDKKFPFGAFASGIEYRPAREEFSIEKIK